MIVATPFVRIAGYELKALGLPEVALIEVDYAVGSCGPEEAAGYVRSAERAALAAILAPEALEVIG